MVPSLPTLLVISAIGLSSASAASPAQTAPLPAGPTATTNSEPTQVRSAKPATNDAVATLDNFVDRGMKRSLRHEERVPSIEELELESTEEFLANTNLVAKAANTNETKAEFELRRYWTALRSARELRQATNAPQAILMLVRLLETRGAPADLKSQALFELGLAAQQEGQHLRAFQIFSQFVHRFQNDPRVPEALLRQGMLQRDMGAKALALSKFYAVLSTAMKIKEGDFNHYQRLVLKAQTEIADTHFAFGDFEAAADFYKRLGALRTAQLDKGTIHFKQIRALWRATDYPGLIGAAREFLNIYPVRNDVPEVRYLLANALKRLGRGSESLDEVLELLRSQQTLADADRNRWAYWQQRTGNTIANELYREGDYLSALEIYLNLAKLNEAASWQLPVWYQTGLVYERLRHPKRAREIYAAIVSRRSELGDDPAPSLSAIVEMAEWRADFLKWQVKAERDTGGIMGRDKEQAKLPKP